MHRFSKGDARILRDILKAAERQAQPTSEEWYVAQNAAIELDPRKAYILISEDDFHAAKEQAALLRERHVRSERAHVASR